MITTIDTKRPLFDFCAGKVDNYVGLIESGRAADDDTNLCKLYEIGRRRDIDEEEEEEQDEQVFSRIYLSKNEG